MPPLNPLVSESKLIQVTDTAMKHGHKSFLSQLGGFFPHFSLRVEGRLWIGWVVRFGGFDCCFPFVVGGARNELINTFLTLVLTPLKANTQKCLRQKVAGTKMLETQNGWHKN
jgi:hypothetical protein